MNHIQRYPINTTGRDFAIGDIHGHFSEVMNLLVAVKFDAEKDRLFSVGDMVDRGHQSHHAVRWLQQPWFHAVMGNHEDIAIRYQKGNPVDRDIYSANGGDWFMALAPETQRLFAEEFVKLPVAIEVETAEGIVGLVHADCPFPTWEQLRQELENPSKPSRLSSIEDRCMWSRARIEFMDRSGVDGVRAVVVGHTPLDDVTILGNVYHIDTGGWTQQGHFTLLDLATLQTVEPSRKLEWEAE